MQLKRTLAALALATLTGCANAPAMPAIEGPMTMTLQSRVPTDRRQLLDDEGGSQDWNLQQIGVTGYKVQSNPGARAVVAVLDTGVDPNHPNLGGHVYPVEDMVGNDVYSKARTANFTGVDGNGHGTHVAGIIASVASGFNVRILPVKVIPNSGVGDDQLLSDGIDRALSWRDPQDASIRVRVMNLSVSSPRTSKRLSAAIQRAVDAGVVVVCAAGNEGTGVDFPASMPQVLTVGATTIADSVADYSCHGPAVDIAAPGGDDGAPLYSTWPTYLTADDLDAGVSTPHAHAGLIGTSMATPHVAAMAAIELSQHPALDAQQVRSALLAMTDDLGSAGPDNYYGFGRLDYQRVLGAISHDAH